MSTLAHDPAMAMVDGATATRSTMVAIPWQRIALGIIVVAAIAINFWQLTNIGYGNTYYAAAVRSMLTSWHAFFFNALDPNGFVTIDKPPLGFWFQVVSAKIFGYTGLSLMLPQALAGVLSVIVLYALVARRFGVPAGLIAALVLALTPINVAANRNNIIDSTLVLFLLFAAWSVLRATETGRLRWLLVTAAMVGLGFNVKMLEAYLAVPAFGLVYLVGAHIALPKRLAHLAVAGVVMLAISLSWAVAVDMTPASQRPYVGSSTANSEIQLAFGYNGVQRLTGNLFRRSGAATPRATSTPTPAASTSAAAQAAARGFTIGESGNPSPLRLFGTALGGQISWLIPFALLGAVAAIVRRRERRLFPLDTTDRAIVLFGMWLITEAAFFSVAGFFHAYYMVTMAPAIAALVGIGAVVMWRQYHASGWRGFFLPIAVLATAGTQAAMLVPYAAWSRWLTPIIVVGSLAAVLVLVLHRLGTNKRASALAGAAALAAIALLVAPTAWVVDTIASTRGGGVPQAGPTASVGRGNGAANRTGGFRTSFGGAGGLPGAVPPTGGRGGIGGDTASVNAKLLQYLEANQKGTPYLFATLSSMTASPYIITSGKAVMVMGGFSGADRIVTPTQIAQDVKNNTVRFFLMSAPRQFNLANLPAEFRALAQRFGGGGGFGGNANADITSWVTTNCAVVPASLWQQSPTTTGTDGGGFGRGGANQLYDCSLPASARIAATVPQAPVIIPLAPQVTPVVPSSPSVQTPIALSGVALSGQWQSASASQMSITTLQGTQSLMTSASTRFLGMSPITVGGLKVGQRVAISLAALSSTAASITVLQPGDPTVTVRGQRGFGGDDKGGSQGLGDRGGGTPPGGSPGQNGGLGAPSIGGGGTGFGGRQFRQSGRLAHVGTIIALSATSVTIHTTTGANETIQLASSTAVYSLITLTASQIAVGAQIAVMANQTNSQPMATLVVVSPTPSVIPVIGSGLAAPAIGLTQGTN